MKTANKVEFSGSLLYLTPPPPADPITKPANYFVQGLVFAIFFFIILLFSRNTYWFKKDEELITPSFFPFPKPINWMDILTSDMMEKRSKWEGFEC
ncbi:hypothetical protein [Bacillus atrophaeus]|uniref:hypothetical protein n=1 Tax=Bacillus atrophaeus TaxID=1452 RepID=UPI002281B929|nr:hypothetical protein [Bacillus atrophaeus]MCY8507392.1 hypothetical protein [Bacillus atrophaeus]MCY8949173.1 hypothetical protein [Bacillus atrophaeus]MCY8967590.1 hypothetical protein [Bacillus atrophaeus]